MGISGNWPGGPWPTAGEMLGRAMPVRSVKETNPGSESLIAMPDRGSVRETNHVREILVAMLVRRSVRETNPVRESLIAMLDRGGKENHRGIGKSPVRERVKVMFACTPCDRKYKSSFCGAS